MHDMRFSAGQAALKFNKLGPVHFIDIRANIEIRSGAAELKRGHAALLSNNPNTGRWQPYLERGSAHASSSPTTNDRLTGVRFKQVRNKTVAPRNGFRLCHLRNFSTRSRRQTTG